MNEPQPEPMQSQPTRVLEMRMLAAKGEIGGSEDCPSQPMVKSQPYTGISASGITACCERPLDDHNGLIETNDARLWICPTEETNGS